MDLSKRMQNAIDYLEEHLTEKTDYGRAAKCAFYSLFHFERIFAIIFGITPGEYVRRRRLTLAGEDLLSDNVKVIDVAYKYGYETPESFSRAFKRFHGILPSQAKNGCKLRAFSRIKADIKIEGGIEVDYKIEKKGQKILMGYKKRFTGVPYGEERAAQEKKFVETTRAKQWLLIGASSDYSTDYCIVDNITDNGYDFYIAYELDEWTRNALFDTKITGVDFMDKMGFETLIIPENTYAVFETQRKKRPVIDYIDIRNRIVSEWQNSSGYVFADAPELVIMHWRPKGDHEKERYIEVCIPVEKSGE